MQTFLLCDSICFYFDSFFLVVLHFFIWLFRLYGCCFSLRNSSHQINSPFTLFYNRISGLLIDSTRTMLLVKQTKAKEVNKQKKEKISSNFDAIKITETARDDYPLCTLCSFMNVCFGKLQKNRNKFGPT